MIDKKIALEDGTVVFYDDFSKASHCLRRVGRNKKEFESYLIQAKKIRKWNSAHVLFLRRYGIAHGLDVLALIRDSKVLEDVLSLRKYKKFAKCLDYEEKEGIQFLVRSLLKKEKVIEGVEIDYSEVNMGSEATYGEERVQIYLKYEPFPPYSEATKKQIDRELEFLERVQIGYSSQALMDAYRLATNSYISI